MNILKPISALLLTTALISGVSAEINESSAITAIDSNWSESFNAGQISTLFDMYTHNAVVIPPSSEILSYQAAITSYWNELRNIGMGEYRIDTIDVLIEGDIAYQLALWEATLTTADGNTTLIDGTMTNVLQRQPDGHWKIRLQSWN